MKTNFGLKVGDYCVFKEHPNYSFAKILKFVKVNGVSCAECEHTVGWNDLWGFNRTFKLRDLKKWKPPQQNAEGDLQQQTTTQGQNAQSGASAIV